MNTVSLNGEIECSGHLASCHPCPYRCTNVILARTFYIFFSMLTFTVTFPAGYGVGSWIGKQTVCYYNHIFKILWKSMWVLHFTLKHFIRQLNSIIAVTINELFLSVL